MLRLFIITTLWVFPFLGNSQVLISLLLGDKLNSGEIEFGLDGGLSLSDLSGLDAADWHANYNLGFYFDFKMKNPDWLLNTGVRVKSTLGAENLPVYTFGQPDIENAFVGGEVTRKLNYFHVPVSMKYKFSDHFYAHGGIQLGLMYKATDHFTKNVEDKNDLNYKHDIKSQYHPLDGGFLAGIGYRITEGNGMNIGIQYYYGVIDVEVTDALPNQFNQCLYVNAGIPIGRGKAMAESEQE